MILSDKDIAEALTEGRIGCDPAPELSQYQPASLDVRLGDHFIKPRYDEHFTQDPLVLDPDERILATTQETIELPNDLAAQLAGRSTIGRMGVIVHKTAGWIDPGFEGQITLEMYNMGRETVRLDVGMRVAQLVFFQLSSSSSGYDGHYQGQQGATEAYND